MLVDVTAILSTSSTQGTVDEAFSVSASWQTSIVTPATMSPEQTAWMAALDSVSRDSSAATPPDPFIGPQPVTAAVSLEQLPKLRGIQLLDQLTLLSAPQLNAFVSKHADVIAGLLQSPPSASKVAALWTQTSAAQHAAMLSGAPELVGGLEGFPYSARDMANRVNLSTAEHDIRQQLKAGVGRAASDELTKRLHMLGQVRKALDVGSSGNRRELVSLDPTGEGRAVIVIGNASTADYVDYLIPGMFSDVDTQIVAFADSSDNIATEQQAWIKRLNPGVASDKLPTVATFAWIGYHTPNIVNVASMQLAREGQQSLTASIEGLRAERAARVVDGKPGAQPYVAILAHSYGTTAAMLSLEEDDVTVDALAIVGSPGSPARSVSQLKVTGGNVWVGAAQTDPVPQTGIFGSQPLSSSFGAHRFGVDGATDPLTGKSMRDALGHNDYFVTGTESLRNMVLIGIGRGDLVLGQDGKSALSIGKGRAVVSSGPSV